MAKTKRSKRIEAVDTAVAAVGQISRYLGKTRVAANGDDAQVHARAAMDLAYAAFRKCAEMFDAALDEADDDRR